MDYLGTGYGKIFSTFSEYKKNFPSGKLDLYARIASLVMIAGLIVTFLCIVWANLFPAR